MKILFLILIIVACLVLAFVILVQNPKGGGLSGALAGFNNQIMGVKQTTDVLEKGTWIFATVIGVLCILSTLFLRDTGSDNNNRFRDLNPNATKSAPAPQTPAPGR